MRKLILFICVFGMLMLILTQTGNTASCKVHNGSLEDLYVVYATWMKADGKYPEGFRVTGWQTIQPGGAKTFNAENAIYVRAVMKHTVVKPANSPQTELYAFSVNTSRESFTTVETSTGEVIYSSVGSESLTNVGGFYEFTDNGTFEVEGGYQEWLEDTERRRKKRARIEFDIGTCDTPSTHNKPLLSGSFNQSTQASTVKAVTRKAGMGLWTRKDTVSSKDDGNTGPLILTVKFLPDSNDPNWKPGDPKFNVPFKKQDVEKYVLGWSRHANIHFEFVKSGAADIRISFVPELAKDKKSGKKVWTWLADSYVGTDSKSITSQSQKTMTLGCPEWEVMTEGEVQRVVLHEFGHALGFGHEHQNKHTPIRWNEKGVLAYYKDKMRWTPEETKDYVLDPLSEDWYNFSEFDPNSIMLYPIRSVRKIGDKEYRLAFNDVAARYNTNLSREDKAAIRRMYPYPSDRDQSGKIMGIGIINNSAVYHVHRIPFTVSGKGQLFGGIVDWTKTYPLPTGKIGKIESVKPVMRVRKRGWVTRWKCDSVKNPKQVTLYGKIEEGWRIYGTLKGHIEVMYIPKSYYQRK